MGHDTQESQRHSWNGIVSKDKDPNSVDILVYVPELAPLRSGKLSAVTTRNDITLKDVDGNTINSSALTSNSITATYWGGDTNRKYPPDVVTGEQVEVFKFYDSDKYYWESIGRNDDLRKTETYRIEVSDDNSIVKVLSSDNTYSLEIDTKRGKHVKIQTAKSDGESYAYTFNIDAKTSTVVLCDDIGNQFSIDSGNAVVQMQNSKRAVFSLNGEDINCIAPRDILIKAGRQIVIDAPNVTYSNSSGDGVTVMNASAMAINAGSFVVTGDTIGLNGNTKIGGAMFSAHTIRAESFQIGVNGASYVPASINLESGRGTSPNTVADTAAGTDLNAIYRTT